MELSEPPIGPSGVRLSYTDGTSDVDINNNNVTAYDPGDRPKLMTGSATGSGPEAGYGAGAVGPSAGWNPSVDGSTRAAAGVTVDRSPLVVDGEIGRVFLSANQALYGCDEHDAAETNATRPGAGDVDVEDDDDGRLFIALESLSPNGGRVASMDGSKQLLDGKHGVSVVGPGLESSGTEVLIGTRPVGRRRIREQDKPLECVKCGRRFILNKMLENHKCGVLYTCVECGKPFKKRCQLQAHSFIHKQAKDFVCGICQRAFKEKSNFNRHVRTHSSLRPYKCPHCVKCFKVAATLYVHRLTHDARGRFVCDFCGKDFKRPEHLRQHRRIHTGERPYRCAVCQQCFTTDNTLRTHMRRHTGERPYPCPICQKRFTQSSAMKTHWKRHSESREFDCPVCHLKFKQKYDLNRHMVSHNTERPHQCSVCHLRFKTRSSLQKHRETHSEERQFACATCGKAFRRLSYLRLHEATHGANTRFACPQCNKSFTRRYNLRLHQEEHEEGGRRRHFCSKCRRCFRRAASLHQHVVTAHGGSDVAQDDSQPTPGHEEPHSNDTPVDQRQGDAHDETKSDVADGAVVAENDAATPGLKPRPESETPVNGNNWIEGISHKVECDQRISSHLEDVCRLVCDQDRRCEENPQERQCEAKEESSEEELVVD